MKTVLRHDRAALRRPEATSQGFLRVEGYASRAGIYEYRNDDGSPRYELRPREEVSRPESLASFDAASVTLGHPPEEVTADNVRRHEVGTVVGAARMDGDHVAVTMVIKDARAIKQVQAGTQELSPGYRIDLDETPGFAPEYATPANPTGRYHAIQRKIRINHQAIVPRARGGFTARIRMDALEEWRSDEVLDAAARHALSATDFAIPDREGLPIHDETHLRAAMSYFSSVHFKDDAEKRTAYRRILGRAKALGVDASGFAEKYRMDSGDKLTTLVDGHQHKIDDCGMDDDGCTSYATSAGASMPHAHDWIRNADGTITIAANEGHTHGILEESLFGRADSGGNPNHGHDGRFTSGSHVGSGGGGVAGEPGTGSKITDIQYDVAQNNIDALTRKTGRGRRGTPEENARFHEIYNAWEAANALPQTTAVQREARDRALYAVADKHGLLRSDSGEFDRLGRRADSGRMAQPTMDADEQIRSLKAQLADAVARLRPIETTATQQQARADQAEARIVTLTQENTDLRAQIASAQTAIETEALKRERHRADTAEATLREEQSRFDSAVETRVELERKAAVVMGPEFVMRGMPERQIISTVVKRLDAQADTSAKVSDAFLRGRFESLIEMHGRNARSLQTLGSAIVQPTAQRDDSLERDRERMRNWGNQPLPNSREARDRAGRGA